MPARTSTARRAGRGGARDAGDVRGARTSSTLGGRGSGPARCRLTSSQSGRWRRRALRASPAVQFEEWQIALHGRRVIYRIAGSGPPVVLIHGMLNSSSHWQSVALELAREHTVIAPDLIGHGDSAAPRGDYSLGAHAASIRDLLAAIGIERASIVGHSLGGGVAMQFFYQFPQRVERLVLISSGGLGHEVSPMLRSAALPGVSALLSLTIQPRLLGALAGAGRRMRERALGGGVHLQAIARALRPLENADARQAFLTTLRSVIDVHGQRVSATDRLYLLETMPTMIVWGERDNTIPLAHGAARTRRSRGSRLQDAARRRALPASGRPRTASRALLREFIERDRARDASRTPTGARCSRGARPTRRGRPDATVRRSGWPSLGHPRRRRATRRIRQRAERALELLAQRLQRRRQRQALAEMALVLVDREARADRRDLEQHAARLAGSTPI